MKIFLYFVYMLSKCTPAKFLFLACLAAGILLMAVPVDAALQPHFFSGQVTAVDKDQGSITLQTGSDDFKGTAPNTDAVRDLSPGDAIIAVSLGSRGERWVFIGRLKPGTNFLTDGYGDIAFLPADDCDGSPDDAAFCDLQVLGGYQVSYSNTPDCANCTGCNCKAAATRITLTLQDAQEMTQELLPGESFTHDGAAYAIKMHFIAGEIPAYPECSKQMCAGPQPVSNFVVNIMPQNDEANVSGNGDGNCFISDVLQKCSVSE